MPQTRTPLDAETIQTVLRHGEDHNVSDPRFLLALFQTEGGVTGREFGYGVDAQGNVPTRWMGLPRQAAGAAFQLAKHEQVYTAETGNPVTSHDGTYTAEFINHFSNKYAPPGGPAAGISNDPQNLNSNHAVNLLTGYAKIARGTSYEEDRKRDLSQPKPTGDQYGPARSREEQIGKIVPVVGPEQADLIGNMQAKELQDYGAFQPVMDYVVNPIGKALQFVSDQSRSVRSFAVGQGYKPTPMEEITGIPNETKAPLRKHFLALELPRTTLNLLADVATDPLVIGGPLLSNVARGLKAGKELLTGGQTAKSAGAGPPSLSSAGDTQSVLPSTIVKNEPGKITEAERLNTKLAEQRVLDPANAGYDAGTPPVPQPLQVHPMKQPIPANVKAAIAKDVMTPEETSLVSEYNATQKAKTKLFEDQQKFLAEQPTKVAPKYNPDEALPSVKEKGVVINVVPHPALEAGQAQAVLTGFGRFMRKQRGETVTDSTSTEAVNKIVTPDPKQMSLDFSETVGWEELFANARKEIDAATLSDPQTRAVAQQLLDTQKVNRFNIAGRVNTEYPEQAKVVAEAAIQKSVVDSFIKTVDSWKKSKTPEDMEKAIAQMATLTSVTKAIRSTEAERAAAMRMTRSGQSPEVKAFETLMENLPEGTTFERAVGVMDLMTNAEAKRNVVKSLAGVGPWRGSVIQVMINGLISGTGMPIWNYAAGTSLFGAKVFERWRMSKYADSTVASGEAGVMAWAFLKSYIDLATAGSKLDRGLPARARLGKEMENATNVFTSGDAEKYGGRRAISATSFGKEDSFYSPAIDYLGHAINVPTYLASSSDAFLRFATNQAFMEASAYREAAAEVQAQLAFGKQLSKADVGKLMDKRRGELMANPKQMVMSDGKLVPLEDIGKTNSDLLSMMTQLQQGTVGATINDAMAHSILGRATMPFFRVQYLTGAEAIKRVPIINRLSPSMAADFAAGGERAAKANAQLATGKMMAAWAVMLTSLGYMNGDGPADPRANALWKTTHVPNSFQFPSSDLSVPYTRLGPLGNVMRFWSNMAYMLPRIADSEELANDFATTMGVSFASLVSDSSFNKDLSDLFAGVSGRDDAAIGKFLDKKIQAFVPYSALLRQVNKQIDGVMKIPGNVWERATILLPNENGTTYYDAFGQPAEVPNDTVWDSLQVNFGFPTPRNPSPQLKAAVDAMDKYRIVFTPPERVHDGVPMTVAEHMELKRLFGNDVEVDGKTFIPALHDFLTHNEVFKEQTDGPKGGKQAMLSDFVSAFKQQAYYQFEQQEDTKGNLTHADFLSRVQKARNYKANIDQPPLQAQ